MKLVAVVLAFNEQRHLPRCLASLAGVADEVVVADCFSTDDTLRIAEQHGAKIVQRAWVNYATQFNWALTQLDSDTDWVLRLDADEVLTPQLAAEIRSVLPGLSADVDGVYCGRRMTFQGRMIRWGGVFPIRVLRLFRFGRGERARGLSGYLREFLGNSRHLWMWDFKGLSAELREAGFVDIRRAQYGDSTHAVFAETSSWRRPIRLYCPWWLRSSRGCGVHG